MVVVEMKEKLVVIKVLMENKKKRRRKRVVFGVGVKEERKGIRVRTFYV